QLEIIEKRAAQKELHKSLYVVDLICFHYAILSDPGCRQGAGEVPGEGAGELPGPWIFPVFYIKIKE
ncbi:MAG: hypothetical protein IJU93_10325, partial [Lachnospiraceae bacterium]|nr:hypothetical protein [Lachnospiraceae bacterium]